MTLEQAKNQFIQTWGSYGSQWGINRTMAQIHAYLLVSDGPRSTDEIMQQLSISRGNANMNLRELINWNLLYRESISGDRREYFRAEKDMWEVAKRILQERKRREFDPLTQHLQELKKVEQSYESISFVATIENIERLINRMDSFSKLLIRADEHVFFGRLMELFK